MAFLQSAKVFNQKTITLLASNVTAGIISKHWKNGRNLTYLYMAVATGSAAPSTKKFLSNSADMFPENSEQCEISTSEAVDVYGYANIEESGNTDKAYLIVSV